MGESMAGLPHCDSTPMRNTTTPAANSRCQAKNGAASAPHANKSASATAVTAAPTALRMRSSPGEIMRHCATARASAVATEDAADAREVDMSVDFGSVDSAAPNQFINFAAAGPAVRPRIGRINHHQTHVEATQPCVQIIIFKKQGRSNYSAVSDPTLTFAVLFYQTNFAFKCLASSLRCGSSQRSSPCTFSSIFAFLSVPVSPHPTQRYPTTPKTALPWSTSFAPRVGRIG